jgi:hypothetical protein
MLQCRREQAGRAEIRYGERWQAQRNRASERRREYEAGREDVREKEKALTGTTCAQSRSELGQCSVRAPFTSSAAREELRWFRQEVKVHP